MPFTKLRTTSEAGGKLRALRQRTGLTPNLLSRVAVMLSLEEGAIGPGSDPDEGGLEFNAYTFTGEHTGTFLALVRFVEAERQPDAETLTDEETTLRLRAHLHRGVRNLAVRVRSAADVARLAAPPRAPLA